MKRVSLILVCLLLLTSLSSCAFFKNRKYVREFETVESLEKFSFESEKPYTLELDNLTEINIDFLYLIKDGNSFRFAKADEEPDLVAINSENLDKLIRIANERKTLLEISIKQSELINVEKEKVNALQKMLELERENRILERKYRINVENELRNTKRDLTLDRLINRGIAVVGIVGGILIATL